MSQQSALPSRLAHVSLAVNNAEETAALYEKLLGASIRNRETLPDRGLQVIFLDVAGVPIELVQPIDAADESNPVAKYLKKQGEGIHHMAFEVADAAAALNHARESGAELVDAKPRPGADGCQVAFLHPRSTAGALIEYVEKPSSNS